MPRINLAANPDHPYATVKRQLGKLNSGLYCENCAQFFALAVVPARPGMPNVEYVADGPLLFECPFCDHRQMRTASEIANIILTEGNRRRPPIPPGLH